MLETLKGLYPLTLLRKYASSERASALAPFAVLNWAATLSASALSALE